MPTGRIKLSEEMLIAAIGEHWPPEQVSAAMQALSGSDGKFPAGARRLPPDLISAVQRERLIAAMLNAASELGYRALNVQDVLDRAGVSRPTFYEHFANKEDCFLAAFDTAAARLRTRIESAAGGGKGSWREWLRPGLEELLRFVAAEPELARMLIVEARAASAEAVLRRDDLLDHFARCIDGRVRDIFPGARFSSLTAVGIVGGIESLLYARLSEGRLDDLDPLLPSLMYFAVLPYEGHEAASRETAPSSG